MRTKVKILQHRLDTVMFQQKTLWRQTENCTNVCQKFNFRDGGF